MAISCSLSIYNLFQYPSQPKLLQETSKFPHYRNYPKAKEKEEEGGEGGRKRRKEEGGCKFVSFFVQATKTPFIKLLL